MAAPGVFGKLNLKEQTEIVVLNAPETFDAELAKLRGVAVRRNLSSARPVSFGLAFVARQADLDSVARALTKMAEGDACDFNRDTGWAVLGAAGFEGVRAVAIDEDWSALRFRRAEFIKKLTRDAAHAMSAVGRKRAARNKKKK